nr:hypothetical protein [Tanacetum cinerariifolium]
FTIAKDISAANVPVTTTSAEINTASPEDKTAKTFDDSDDITLAKTLIKIRRSAKKPQKELAQRLYEEELAEVDRAQKERQKQKEATIAVLTKEFNKIQARMNIDHEHAARLTYEEQEQFTIEEREKLLIMKVNKLVNKVKSHKARRRVKLIVLKDEDDFYQHVNSNSSIH